MTSYGQKVSIEQNSDEPIEKTESKNIVVETAEISTSVVVASGPQIEASPIASFDKFQAYDSFERVIQFFPSLQCKNKYTNSLDLSCYECGYTSTNNEWVLSFSRKEVGDENCSLARVQRKTDSIKSFERNIERDLEALEKSFKVEFTKVGERFVAATDQVDIQVYKLDEFSVARNQFVKKGVVQLQYLYALVNQEKIQNAIELMQSAFKNMKKKAFTEFMHNLFPEDSGERKLEMENWILGVTKTKDSEPIVNGDPRELSPPSEEEEMLEKLKQKEKNLAYLRSLSFYASLKEQREYQTCYYDLLGRLLPLELTEKEKEEFSAFKFLKFDELPAEKAFDEEQSKENIEEQAEATSAKEILPVSKKFQVNLHIEPGDSKDSSLKCEYFSSLRFQIKNQLDTNILCEKIGEQFLEAEKGYKDFFEGKDLPEFKMVRALKVSELLKISEAEYFYELEELQRVNEKETPDAEALKEQAQKLELAYNKVSDYADELEGILAFMGESLKLRKDWMVRGVASNQVFDLCQKQGL